MVINERDIHIYRHSLETSSELLREYETLLSRDELQKAYRYRFEKDKIHYITGRALLRIIAAEYLDEAPGKINFSYKNKGKPFIKGSAVKFNLAHSGGIAVYAFAKNMDIGIDTELVREMPDALKIAMRFFSEEEVKEISELSEDKIIEAFFNCWTRKEAFIKAVGEGLSFPLKDFTVTLKLGDEPKLRSIKNNSDEAKEWSVFKLDSPQNYITSLAVRSNKDVKIIYK